MLPGVFIFIGRSGSGKGTQAKLLEEYLAKEDSETRVLYLQTGEQLRRLTKRETYSSKRVRETLERGGLLPEFLPIWIWTEFFIENYTGAEHIIFDGITRKPIEAPVLEGALRFYEISNPHVILIDVSEAWATDRLLERGRYDDTREDIKERMRWYEKDVLPTIEHYNRSAYFHVHHINGEQTIEKVHEEIVGKLQ